MAPLVTLAIPVRNGEAYLAQTLASIRAQSFGDYELLIVVRAGAEGETVEDVVHLLVGRLLAGGQRRGRCRPGGRDGSGWPRRHRGGASQREQGQPEQRVERRAENRQA